MTALPDDGATRRHLDVRPILAEGAEPYDAIMEAVDGLGDGEVLVLETPFDPQPLHDVLAKRGFSRATEEKGAGHFATQYWRGRAATTPDPGAPPVGDGRAPGAASSTEVVLDVRGMQPPEPVALTLEALEALPDGGRLVQVNERVPVFLLPHLDELGFAYSITEDERGTIVTITRAAA